MREWVAYLCLLTLCLFAATAQAESLVFTGTSGFTVTLPEDWFALIGGDEEPDNFDEELEPGDTEALFSSYDGTMSVTVLYPDDSPVEPYLVEGLFSEPSMEARVGQISGYQKLLYRYDDPNHRAFLSYNLVDVEEGVSHVEYLVSFIAGSGIAQHLKITVRADQLDARYSLISEIVNNIDVGGVREGAEG